MVHKPRRDHGTLAEEQVLHPVQAKLEKGVADLLATTGSVDASDVKVTAFADGTINLSGRVCSSEEVERCTEIALSVEGVKSVQNELAFARESLRSTH